MKVVINGRFLSRQMTGVERYGREIVRCLSGRVQVIEPLRWRRGLKGHTWEQLILPAMLGRDTLLWSPANTGPLFVASQVLTLHDLSPLEHPEWFTKSFASGYRLLLPRLVHRVRHVVTSSRVAQKKLRQVFSLPPEKVSVVPGGVNVSQFHPNQKPPTGLPRQYILFVGSLQPRKNLDGLLIAWQQLSQRFRDHWLLIAGGQDAIFRRGVYTHNIERVHYLGYVSELDLPGLYVGAQAFIMPSLDEGFGLPVLEAMACGTPVVAAAAGALPEVVGEAGLLFKLPAISSDSLALQSMGLTEAIEHCLSDTNLRNSLVEKGLARVQDFSWQKAANKMEAIFQLCQ